MPSPDRRLSTPGRCPCSSGETYAGCCGPFHRGEATAPTAERLMRSRYSAFVVGDGPYLLATWHPRTRPPRLELDSEQQWTRLDVVRTIRGGPLEREGTVEFVAHFRINGERGQQHETSRFVKLDRQWYYLDSLE